MKQITHKSKRMLQIEQSKGEDIEETLRRMFVDENMPTETIADELSISYVTAFKWLNLAGVHSRKLDIGC